MGERGIWRRSSLKNNILSSVLDRLSRQLEMHVWLSRERSVWVVNVTVGDICLQSRGSYRNGWNNLGKEQREQGGWGRTWNTWMPWLIQNYHYFEHVCLVYFTNTFWKLLFFYHPTLNITPELNSSSTLLPLYVCICFIL